MAGESAPKVEALETGYESGAPLVGTERVEKTISLPIETVGVQETVLLSNAVEPEAVGVAENSESDTEDEEQKTFWQHMKSAADSVKTEVVDFFYSKQNILSKKRRLLIKSVLPLLFRCLLQEHSSFLFRYHFYTSLALPFQRREFSGWV